MPTIVFTENLRRYVDVAPVAVVGATVAEALDGVFIGNPRLRSYLLDDQGALRKHVNLFVDGRMLRDRQRLTDPVSEATVLHVIQALSGG